MTKKLSILIPSYNSEKTICRCLESIPYEYDDEIDIIILNDGSTDNSENIIRSLNRNSISIFSNDNMGLAKARSFLISKVKTKYFIFIDSDDFFIKGNFKKIIEQINYEFDICVPKTLIKKKKCLYYLRQLNHQENNDINWIVNNSFIYFWNIIFSKQYIDDLKIKIHNNKCEDWGITDYIFLNAKNIIFMDEFTMVYDKNFSTISKAWKNPYDLENVLFEQYKNLFSFINLKELNRKIDFIYTYLIIKVFLTKFNNVDKIKFLIKIKRCNLYNLLFSIKKPKFRPFLFFVRFKNKKTKMAI